MKHSLKVMAALVVGLSLSAQAADTTADVGALAAVRQFIESLNAGNLDGARAGYAALDECGRRCCPVETGEHVLVAPLHLRAQAQIREDRKDNVACAGLLWVQTLED